METIEPLSSVKGARLSALGFGWAIILSLNAKPVVRETFAAFQLEPAMTTHGISQGGTAAKELIVKSPRA